MRRLLQIMGLLLIVGGVWSLLHADWVLFGMFSAQGIVFLLDPKKSKDVRKLRRFLMLVAFMLAVGRILNIL